MLVKWLASVPNKKQRIAQQFIAKPQSVSEQKQYVNVLLISVTRGNDTLRSVMEPARDYKQ